MMRAIWVGGLVLGMMAGGCVTQERIDQRFGELIVKWKSENPDLALSEEVKAQLYKEAVVQVEREVAEERKEAGEKTAGLVTSVLSGNWIGAAFSALGLAGLGIGAYRKAKGVA